MIIANEEVRDLIQENRVKYWEVAKELGITDTTFSKKLRNEFSEDYKAKVISIINQLAHKTF